MKISSIIDCGHDMVNSREYSNTDLLLLTTYSQKMFETLEIINPNFIKLIESSFYNAYRIKSFKIVGITITWIIKRKIK